MAKLKVVIAGGRSFRDWDLFNNVVTDLVAPLEDIEIISGGAAGADTCAERYAKDRSIPFKIFEAEWEKYGKKAGPIRNRAMAEASDILIAFWDGKSPGTKNMINEAMKFGLEIHIMRY